MFLSKSESNNEKKGEKNLFLKTCLLGVQDKGENQYSWKEKRRGEKKGQANPDSWLIYLILFVGPSEQCLKHTIWSHKWKPSNVFFS